ncbi:hypothetical protein HDU97_002674 [Phlyctochytrium planicorne]|nr:hypothetical protein HDU97_002674 [Phlyctochytrium planicorne]
MSAKTKLIDDETIEFLGRARDEDIAIISSIGNERKDIEFKYRHSERLNNWRTDELYITRSQEVEATFLESIHDEEHETFLKRQVRDDFFSGSLSFSITHTFPQAEEAAEQMAIENDRKTFGQIMSDIKDLKLQSLQNRAAADMRKSAKRTVKERRQAVRARLSRLEIRQERERRSLAEAHNRQLKDIKLTRNLKLKEVEDPELRIIISGHEFNEKTLAAENAKIKAQTVEETRLMNAKIFSLLVRNTKEIEQLREIHLLKLKHTTKYCDMELEAMDEFESLVAQHTAEEQRVEAELKNIADRDETELQSEMTAARVKAAQAEQAQQAAVKRLKLREEAKNLKKKFKEDAKKREKQFWAAEEQALKEFLIETNQYDPNTFETKAFLLLDRSRISQVDDVDDASEEEEIDDYFAESIKENAFKMAGEAAMLEKKFAKEAFKIENMRKIHKEQIQKLKNSNRKLREAMKRAQAQSLTNLLREQEQEEASLKEQQSKEMAALVETQKTSEKVDEDNKALNDRLNAMLPKFVVDAMKRNEPIAPRKFNNLVFLTSDIVQFTSLSPSSQSTANQVISLLNRLYSAMDEVLDSFHDVFKLETIGDAYCIVSGLNSEDRSPRLNTIDIIECALSFIEIVETLDMSDQKRENLEIRIGIHCGAAVGGVANLSQPKFSLFGDTVTTTGLLEQSSKPNNIHVSGPTYELVKDDYEFEVSESISVESPSGGKRKIPTFWLVGRKQNNKSQDIIERIDKKSRSITFDQ